MARGYKSVKRTGVVGDVEGAYSDLQELGSEMGEWRDNLEEKFSSTEKYERVSEAADALEGLSEPDVPSELADIPIEYSEFTSTRGLPRWARRDNAVSIIRTAIDALNERKDGDKPEDVEDDAWADKVSDIESLIDDLESIADEAENVEFPGMYG